MTALFILALMSLLLTSEACSQGSYIRRDTIVAGRMLRATKVVLVYSATKPAPIANTAILWIPGPGKCYMIYGNGSESNLDSVGTGGGGGSGTGDTTFTINVSGFPQIRDSVQLISNAILTWSINGHNLTLVADTLLYFATQFDISLKVDKSTPVTATWGVNASGTLGALTLVGDSTEVATKYDLTLRALLNHTHNTADLTGGILGVPRGGSGRSTWTTNGIPVGNGTSAPNELVPGATPGSAYWSGSAWSINTSLTPVYTFTATVPAGTTQRVAVYVPGVTSSMKVASAIGGTATPIAMPVVTAKTDSVIVQFYSTEDDPITVTGLVR
jgi:hypothetical protein